MTPVGTHGIPNTTVASAPYNANVDDVANDLNVARPIVAGGTGATTPAAACTNLGALSTTGGTMNGSLTIGDVSPSLVLSHTGATGTSRIVGQNNGFTRWMMDLGDSTAESGGNAGSNFALARFSDGGGGIDTPIYISRATGIVTLPDGVSSGGDISMTKAGATSINATVGPLVLSSADATYLRAATGKSVNIADTTNATVTIAGGNGAITTGTGTMTVNGLLAPAAGIIGKTTGSVAAAGNVGEIIQVSNSGVVSIPGFGQVNLVSTTIPAGDWDIWGDLVVAQGNGYASSTTFLLGMGNVSATALRWSCFPVWGTGGLNGAAPVLPIMQTVSTTWYLVFSSNSAAAGSAAVGNATIYARRRR